MNPDAARLPWRFRHPIGLNTQYQPTTLRLRVSFRVANLGCGGRRRVFHLSQPARRELVECSVRVAFISSHCNLVEVGFTNNGAKKIRLMETGLSSQDCQLASKSRVTSSQVLPGSTCGCKSLGWPRSLHSPDMEEQSTC